MPTRVLRTVSAAIAAVLVCTVGLPTAVVADAPTPPYLWVRDAPLTRNQTVQLRFEGPLVNAPPVSAWYASNDNALDGQGHLLNGVSVSWSGPWTLAAGEDGPRTIYGQMLYASGAWSAILELDMILVTDAGSAMAMDIDPQDTSYGQIHLSGGHQWHEVARTPAEPIIASAPSTSEINVASTFWDVGFSTASGPFVPGHYEIGPFDENGNCIGNCGDVWTETNTRCLGTHSGWFDINDIAFDPAGDLRMVDVDFHVICRGWIIEAGTVLYGKERGIVALDQSANQLSFGTVDMGGSSAPKTVSFTNIGDAPVDFGAAAVVASGSYQAPQDYDISSDTCTDATIDPGQSCSVELAFTPTGLLARNALLSIPDNTPRGGREVWLTGSSHQQTTLTLTADGSRIAPGPITFTMTISPPSGPYDPQFHLSDVATYQLQWTERELSNPPRREYSTVVELKPGTYSTWATFGSQGGYLASSTTPFDVVMTGDSTPPVGQIVVTNVHSGYVNDPDLKIEFPATDDDTGLAYMSWYTVFDNRSSSVGTVPYGAEAPVGYTWLQSGGPTTMYAQWRDVAGNWSEWISRELTLDDAAPDVTPPSQEFVTGATITNGRVPVRVPWAADDPVSGVASYQLGQRTDLGTWQNVPLPSAGISLLPSQDATTRALLPGHAYTFRVQATDVATNASGWAVGNRLSLKKRQESSAVISYSGSWARRTAAGFWGGAVKRSLKAGATATITFTGRSIAWVSTFGPTRGRAEVYVNSVLVDTIDLYSPTLSNQRVAWAGNWATSVKRTVTIRVLGTALRPRVDLDAFVTAQ